MEKQLDEVMPALFDALGAPSDRVVLEALAVQASLAASPPHFRFLGAQLLNRHAPQAQTMRPSQDRGVAHHSVTSEKPCHVGMASHILALLTAQPRCF